MAKKLLQSLLLLACTFGLLACQSQPETAPIAAEKTTQSVTPPDSVPFSKGPTGPPGVKGPTAPPGESIDADGQAVTEKDNNTYTIPKNN
jgi:hypothetical protein